MLLKDVQLEISLKAFLRKNAPAPEDVAAQMFEQYRPLWRDAEKISVLLWTGDGSEILEYSGDGKARFDWCRYWGIINRPVDSALAKADPGNRCGYTGQYFEPDTETTCFDALKKIVRAIKTTGRSLADRNVSIGDAFDPGPEFAVSEFKYKLHRECLRGGYNPRTCELLSCGSVLRGDSRKYAAFPDGIPDGIPFGRFFGLQLNAFLAGMNMDFLWLSNGFGFGNWPWVFTGDAFDGKSFVPERAEKERADMLRFWHEFRSVCSVPVRVRGTNFGTGVDLAGDAVPLREIFDRGNLEYPPVNSPWTPINQDAGSEIGGWLTHLAGWNKHEILFRFYPHDPWFPSSPWLDRFERLPYGIYMPMSVSKLRADGTIDTPNAVAFLTVDDRRGEMPGRVPEEIIPHFHAALREKPTRPGPFILVEPFDENHKRASTGENRSGEVMFGDLFVRSIINAGFPMNSVCATDACGVLSDGCVPVSPVPDPGSAWEKNLLDFAARGNTVLFFGPMDRASEKILSAFGFSIAGSGIEDRLTLEGESCIPAHFSGADEVLHEALVSGGGVREAGGKHVLLSARSGSEVRTYAAEAAGFGKGKLLFLHGSASLSDNEAFRVSDKIKFSRPDNGIESGALCAGIAQFSGWKILPERPCEACAYPSMTLHWHENALFFSGINRTSPTKLVCNTPFGAPVPVSSDVFMRGGDSVLSFPKSFRAECRIFVTQENDGLVGCAEYSPDLRDQSRFFYLRGLSNAFVTVLIPESERGKLEIREQTHSSYLLSPLLETEELLIAGTLVRRLKMPYTGNVTVAW